MKTSLLTCTIIIGIAFSSCTKQINKINALEEQSALQKTGVLKGRVTDLRGNGLAGAKIIIEHTVWQGTYLYATTDSNGNYKISIPSQPAGDWTAKAQYEKSAYDQHYIFDLAGNDTAFSQNDVATRNFMWNLSGKKVGANSYYGAHVDVYQFGTDANMNKVKISFTPIESTLIDGSPAVAFERTVEDVAGTFMAKDIPIGKYSIKAIYPNKKLLLENRHNYKGAKVKQPVVFGKYGFLAETEYNIEFWLSE